MKTIDNIVYDNVIYSRAHSLALLLYQMDGVSVTIDLPNGDLMSFIEVFTNTRNCQDHIITKNQNEITLFTYENNIQWLIENSYFKILPQVNKIQIFCSSPEEQQYCTTMTQRYRGIIEKPFLYHDLDFKLLLFGFNHIEKVCEQFPEDQGVKNRLEEDRNKIIEALANYIQQKTNLENDRIRSSDEAQN